MRIAAPAPALAPFNLPQTRRNFIEKGFVNCYNFNPITSAKKGNFQGIL
jgi:hypothetical protein